MAVVTKKCYYSLLKHFTKFTLFYFYSSSGISIQSDELKRKIPVNSPLVSPDSTIHHVVVPPPAQPSVGQITQPIQLVHASIYPPPPSPVKGMLDITCPTPDLPPPPTPLLEEVKVRGTVNYLFTERVTHNSRLKKKSRVYLMYANLDFILVIFEL